MSASTTNASYGTPVGGVLAEIVQPGEVLTVTVSILGNKGTQVTFGSGEDTTAEAALRKAARLLGVDNLNVDQMGVVVDGHEATPATPVRDRSLVTAAANADNG